MNFCDNVSMEWSATNEGCITTNEGRINWAEMNKKLSALLKEWRANPLAVEERFEARLRERPELALGTPLRDLFSYPEGGGSDLGDEE